MCFYLNSLVIRILKENQRDYFFSDYSHLLLKTNYKSDMLGYVVIYQHRTSFFAHIVGVIILVLSSKTYLEILLRAYFYVSDTFIFLVVFFCHVNNNKREKEREREREREREKERKMRIWCNSYCRRKLIQ